jgi:hypothetical protein
MPVADRHIGDLPLEVVPGESRAIRLVDIETLAPGVTWSAVGGRGLDLDASVTVDDTDVVLTFDSTETLTMAPYPWRLMADGAWAAGGPVYPAAPQSIPGEATVTIALADETTIDVTVVAGGGGETTPLSDDDPAPLAAAAAPGVATEAARIDHEHVRPTAAQVGADPAGSASTAQAAAIAAAATDATTKANAAQAAATSAAATDATTKANAAQAAAATDATTKANAAQAAAIAAAATDATTKANTAETDANTYTDAEVDALAELGDSIYTEMRTASGITYVDRLVKAGVAVGGGVASTTTETTLLTGTQDFAANTLSTDSVIFIRASGTWTQNNGSAFSTFRIKCQAQDIFTFALPAIAANAAVRNWRIEGAIRLATFSGIRCFGAAAITVGGVSAAVYDTGSMTVSANLGAAFTLTSAMSFNITAQHSTSSANHSASLTSFYLTAATV